MVDKPVIVEALPWLRRRRKATAVNTFLTEAELEKFLFVSSAKHRHYEKMLKSSGKCFIYGKLVRNTNEVSLRFLLRDTLHEALFTGHQEGNIIDNHS